MRISLLEYGDGIDLNSLFPPGTTYENIKCIFDRANAKIKRHLKINRSAFVVSEGKLRALGVAGTIHLSKDLELEIIPKLLSDNNDCHWKEQLFLLAALSKYGSIITSEHIRSSTAYKYSLYDIAGRVLAEEYSANRRSLLRQYRRKHFVDFSIDGEINFESTFERNPDGIPQEQVSFDKINPYNATIQAAMSIVVPYVKDLSTRNILRRAIQELGGQGSVSHKRLHIPARNKDWREIYNLSFDIVSGMGSSFDEGDILSPSFIVNTWQIWEWLITTGLKIGLATNYLAIPQATMVWGTKITDDQATRINVFPDVAVYERKNRTAPVFLVDAKYKILKTEPVPEIERSDLYEAYAFCNAAGARKLYLAYPTVVQNGIESGTVTVLAKYVIQDVTIFITQVAFGSVGRQGDIFSFCRKLASDILSLAI